VTHQKSPLHRRIALGILALSYVWGAVFGSHVHNLLHHFSDTKHQHSLPCLANGLKEVPVDEASSHSMHSTLRSADCSFKLALHNLCRPTTSESSPVARVLFQAIELYVSARPSLPWINEFPITSASSRGPPSAPAA